MILKKFTLFVFTSGLSFFLNNSINFILIEIIFINIKVSSLISYTILFFLNYYIFKKYIFIKKFGANKTLSLFVYIKLNIILRSCEYFSFINLIDIYEINYLITLNAVSLLFTLIKYFTLRRMTLNN